jgi:hypothetical protein
VEFENRVCSRSAEIESTVHTVALCDSLSLTPEGACRVRPNERHMYATAHSNTPAERQSVGCRLRTARLYKHQLVKAVTMKFRFDLTL